MCVRLYLVHEGHYLPVKTWADPASHTVAYVRPCGAGLSLGLGTRLCLRLGLGLRSEAVLGLSLSSPAPGIGYYGHQETLAYAAARN